MGSMVFMGYEIDPDCHIDFQSDMEFQDFIIEENHNLQEYFEGQSQQVCFYARKTGRRSWQGYLFHISTLMINIIPSGSDSSLQSRNLQILDHSEMIQEIANAFDYTITSGLKMVNLSIAEETELQQLGIFNNLFHELD